MMTLLRAIVEDQGVPKVSIEIEISEEREAQEDKESVKDKEKEREVLPEENEVL